MGQQLCLVERVETVLALELDHNSSPAHKVRPEPHPLKFIGQTGFVSRLKQLRPKRAMNLDRRPYDFKSQIG